VKIIIEIELDLKHIELGSDRQVEAEDFVEILEKVACLSSSLVSFGSTIETIKQQNSESVV
jgi:hypothetical protein